MDIDGHVLQEEARYDGKYLLRTNTSLSPGEVAAAYKSLWQVERAFRERKIWDWICNLFTTEQRSGSGGQVMVCFLALVLEMALRRKVREMGKEVRYRDLLLHLSQLVAVAL